MTTDVLIPAYNAARTIEDSLGTIQLQTVRDLRIVVVDDGSTDDTAMIVRRLAAADERIELVRQPNGGIVDALNRGLAECRSPIVARFDADDRAYPERLERQLALLERRPDVLAVGCAVRHIDEHDRPTGHVARYDDPEIHDALSAPSREPYLCHPFLTVRREAVEAVGGYRHVYNAEDVDLYWRIGEHGKLANMPDILGDYRMHGGSVSAGSVAGGRAGAVFSQLAGIAAARRRSGEADLAFTKTLQEEVRAAPTLEAMAAVGGRALPPVERDRLRIMAAAKWMSLATYRPFELDVADARFTREAIRLHAELLTPSNARSVRTLCWSTAARLLGKGRRAEAAALVGPAEYRHVATRLAFRVLTTPALRRVLNRARGRLDLTT